MIKRSVSINTWASSKAYKCYCHSTYVAWHNSELYNPKAKLLHKSTQPLVCILTYFMLHVILAHTLCLARGQSQRQNFFKFCNWCLEKFCNWCLEKSFIKNILVCWFNSDNKYFSWLLLWYLTNIIRAIFHGSLNIAPLEDYYCSQADE